MGKSALPPSQPSAMTGQMLGTDAGESGEANDPVAHQADPLAARLADALGVEELAETPDHLLRLARELDHLLKRQKQ